MMKYFLVYQKYEYIRNYRRCLNSSATLFVLQSLYVSWRTYGLMPGYSPPFHLLRQCDPNRVFYVRVFPQRWGN